MQAEHTGFLSDRPLGVIGYVIPLPKWIQLAAVEVVVVDERRLGFLGIASIGLDPGIGRLAEISRQTDEWEAVIPSDGNQRNHAACTAMVGHDDAPPFARRGVHNASLMDPKSAITGLGARRCRGRHAH